MRPFHKRINESLLLLQFNLLEVCGELTNLVSEKYVDLTWWLTKGVKGWQNLLWGGGGWVGGLKRVVPL